MGLSLNIKNLDKVMEEIKAYPADIEKIINNEFKVFGQNTVNDAKRLAPVDEGALIGKINFQANNLEIKLGAYVDYAGFIEFGTKAFAAAYVSNLPADWQAFAAQFKSAVGGGSFDQFVIKIFEWIKRKGISPQPKQFEQADTFSSGKLNKARKVKKTNKEEDLQQLAYVFAVSILRKGIKPHPFLFPAFEKNKIELIRNLKAQLNAK